MNRLFHTLSSGLATGGLLLASVTPAAAQPGGQCALVSDAALTQVLGVSAHAYQSISIPDLQSCAVEIADADTITIMHITATEQALLESVGPAGGERVNVTTDAADGFSYPALFLRIPVAGDTLLSLRVQIGDHDVYGFSTRDSADGPARLSAVGHAVLQQ